MRFKKATVIFAHLHNVRHPVSTRITKRNTSVHFVKNSELDPRFPDLQ